MIARRRQRTRSNRELLSMRETLVARYGLVPKRDADEMRENLRRLRKGPHPEAMFSMGPLVSLGLQFFRRVPGEKSEWRFRPYAQLVYDRKNADQLWVGCASYRVDGRGFHGGRSTARRVPVSRVPRAAHGVYDRSHNGRKAATGLVCRAPTVPDDVVVIARILYVKYRADKGSTGAERGRGTYKHEFSEGTRFPYLAVSADGCDLYIVGGSYFLSKSPREGWLVD